MARLKTQNFFTCYLTFSRVFFLSKPVIVMFCLLLMGRTAAARNTLNWTGNSSTDWNTAGNWSPQLIPSSTDEVVIGVKPFARQPALSSNAQCAAVTLGSIKPIYFTINSGAHLTISGTFMLAGSEDNYFPDARVTGEGNLTCRDLVVGNAVQSKVIAIKAARLVSTLADFTVMGDIYINSSTSYLLSGGYAYNNSFFSVQGGLLTVGGQLKLSNTIPVILANDTHMLHPYARFHIDLDSGRTVKMKLIGNMAPSISNPDWNRLDFLNYPGTGSGTGIVEYGGSNQVISTGATRGLDTKPYLYDNLVISGTGTKTTEGSSGDSLLMSGYLTITQSSMDLQGNRAYISVGGDLSNSGTLKLAKATFSGRKFTNKGMLVTSVDSIRFMGADQSLEDSTTTGTAVMNAYLGTGTKTIAKGIFVIPAGGTWKTQDDSTRVSVAPNASLVFKADSTGQSLMTFSHADAQPGNLRITEGQQVVTVYREGEELKLGLRELTPDDRLKFLRKLIAVQQHSVARATDR